MEKLWTNFVDTLGQPVQAFRRMREEPMVAWGIVVAVLSQLGSAVTREGTQEALPGGPVAEAVASTLAFLLVVAVVHYVARALGGRASLGAAVTALGFASLPELLNAPVYLLSVTVGAPALAAIGSTAFSVWSFVLDLLALRAVYEVSMGKAIGIVVLAIVAFLAASVLLAVVAGIVAAALLL